MNLRCPSCQVEFPIEAALGADAARSALVWAFKMPAPLATLLSQYLSMFRASKRAMSFERVDKLLSELQPMIASAQVSRDGMQRAAPIELWQAGLEKLVERRNAGTLTLPLKSHGYLLEVVAGLASKATEAKHQQRERSLQQGIRTNQGQDETAMKKLTAKSRVRGMLALQQIDEAKAQDFMRRIDAGEEVSLVQ